MGDPAGIGAQVIVKALSDDTIFAHAKFVVYGSNESLLLAADTCNVHPNWFRVDANSNRASHAISEPFVVLDDGEDDLFALRHAPSALGGRVSKRWVEASIADSLRVARDPRHIDARGHRTDLQTKLDRCWVQLGWPHRIVRIKNQSQTACDDVCLTYASGRPGHLSHSIDGHSKCPHNRQGLRRHRLGGRRMPATWNDSSKDRSGWPQPTRWRERPFWAMKNPV